MTPLRVLPLTLLLTLFTSPMAHAQPPAAPAPARDQIALGATTAQRNEAARLLVPLLRDVRKRAQGGVTVKPGSVPDSPFAGTQTILFAFSVSKRSVPVDRRVVAAMDTLAAWNIDDPTAEETGRLFDQWLAELMVKNAAMTALQGAGPCDVSCVARRMNTLDATWGATSHTRAEGRDEMLLEALAATVLK